MRRGDGGSAFPKIMRRFELTTDKRSFTYDGLMVDAAVLLHGRHFLHGTRPPPSQRLSPIWCTKSNHGSTVAARATLVGRHPEAEYCHVEWRWAGCFGWWLAVE
jgi:hypothetical protein